MKTSLVWDVKLPRASQYFYYLAEELIRDNRQDINNPLRWNEIKLNLIGNKDYNPAFTNVYTWDKRFQRINTKLITYINDLRSIDLSPEQVIQTARRVCSYLQHSGIQDTTRKRRLDEGQWAGCV